MSAMSETAAPDSGGQPASDRIFTVTFIFACLSTFACFSGFYLLVTTLPVYVKHLGGSDGEVGLTVGLFSASAVLFRLPFGRAADRHGRRAYIVAGTLGLVACSALYHFTHSVAALISLRLLHGAAWAAYGTAVNALVADIVPRERRGEALGYYGMFANLAMAVGPALGFAVITTWGFFELFLATAAISLVGLLLALPIREAPPVTSPSFIGSSADALTRPLIERSALFSTFVLTLAAMSYAAIGSFLPIYATGRGLANPGWFFTANAVTLVAARGLTGKLSDRYGRAAVIAPGLVLAALGLGLLSVATSMVSFLLIAVVYGLGFAAMQPTLMALIVDRVPAGRRGTAMGMFAIAMDLGIATGSLVWGFVAQLVGYEVMYVAAGALTLVAFLVFVVGVRRTSVPFCC